MTPQRSGHAANSAQARSLTVRGGPAARTIDVFTESVRPRSFGWRSLSFLFGRTPRENTLYGLLDVRADADDDALKEAFRKAAKAHHPDLRAGDPHAPLLFRQIVAAYGILRDAEQRAIYDRFLEDERQQLRLRRRRIILSEVISVAVLTVVLLGGYALFASFMTPAVAVAEKDKHMPTTAVVAKVNAEPPKAGAAVAEDKSGAGGRVEMAAVQPAAQAKTIGAEQARHEQRDADIPTEVTAPRTAPPAIDQRETQVAAREPAHELPVGPASHDPRFYRERGIDSYRRGDFRGAIVDLDEAIRLDANDPQAYDLRGNALDEIGDFQRALADYDTAIRINPNNPAPFHDRAILWRRRGDLDKALVDLDRAIRFSFSDANIYSVRGLVWYEKGRRDRAIADFNRAIRLDPKVAIAYMRRGLIMHGSKEFNLAVGDVNDAIRLDTKLLDAIQNVNPRP
jgi:tetratricopeptide (TPR) repeat protein